MPPRVVLTVGNRQRGDDAVGPLIADGLAADEGLRVFDAGLAPENYLGPVIALAPEAVLVVDACEFGGRPGDFRVFGREELERLGGGFVSTHTLPLTLTVAMLEAQMPARIEFLAVQPGTLEFAAGLSGPVAAALPGLVELVRRWTAGG
ncbi:MAG: hydrogenase 3 maturation endopeptidase HyCI [bacterium]